MSNNSLVCLQRIILEEFYHQADALYLNKSFYDDSVICDTETYINIFSIGLWTKVTTASSYYLYVEYDGAGEISIHFADKKLQTIIVETLSLKSCTKTYTHKLSHMSYEYAFISWEESSNFHLKKGEWLASCPSQTQAVSLAICVPTYKRRQDISATIALYEKCCHEAPEFSAASCLYVYNNDTSDDLRELSTCSQVRIVNSKLNIGGAGAFNRCAKFAVDSGYTHALFMDDDALPHTEAWLRTLTILKYIRPEKKEFFLAGNALTREDPTFCHAVREAIDELGHIKRYRIGNLNLQKKEDLLFALMGCYEQRLAPKVHPYAAWWYCAIPSSAFQKYAWPNEHFFYSGDDIDFSLACKARVICCNGINVWHPSFDRPKTLQRRYVAVRNHYMLRQKHFGKKYILKTFFKNIVLLLYAKKYSNAEVTAMAFLAFLDRKIIPISKISVCTNITHSKYKSLYNIIVFFIRIFMHKNKLEGSASYTEYVPGD